VCQKRRDLGSAHFNRVFLAMEENVLLDPIEIGLFGAITVMAGAEEVLDLVK
jgi:hypothetical protein